MHFCALLPRTDEMCSFQYSRLFVVWTLTIRVVIIFVILCAFSFKVPHSSQYRIKEIQVDSKMTCTNFLVGFENGRKVRLEVK
jgi:hypothetical protein